MNSKNYRPRDTLSEKVKALSEGKEGRKEEREKEEEGVCVCSYILVAVTITMIFSIANSG